MDINSDHLLSADTLQCMEEDLLATLDLDSDVHSSNHRLLFSPSSFFASPPHTRSIDLLNGTPSSIPPTGLFKDDSITATHINDAGSCLLPPSPPSVLVRKESDIVDSLWDASEIDLLMQHVSTHGEDWERIGSLMPHRGAKAVEAAFLLYSNFFTDTIIQDKENENIHDDIQGALQSILCDDTNVIHHSDESMFKACTPILTKAYATSMLSGSRASNVKTSSTKMSVRATRRLFDNENTTSVSQNNLTKAAPTTCITNLGSQCGSFTFSSPAKCPQAPWEETPEKSKGPSMRLFFSSSAGSSLGTDRISMPWSFTPTMQSKPGVRRQVSSPLSSVSDNTKINTPNQFTRCQTSLSLNDLNENDFITPKKASTRADVKTEVRHTLAYSRSRDSCVQINVCSSNHQILQASSSNWLTSPIKNFIRSAPGCYDVGSAIPTPSCSNRSNADIAVVPRRGGFTISNGRLTVLPFNGIGNNVGIDSIIGSPRLRTTTIILNSPTSHNVFGDDSKDNKYVREKKCVVNKNVKVSDSVTALCFK